MKNLKNKKFFNQELKNINNYYINENEIHISDLYIMNNKFNVYLNINNYKIILIKRWTNENYGEITLNHYKKLLKNN